MVCYTLALLSVVACCFLFLLEVAKICVSFLLNLQLLHNAIVLTSRLSFFLGIHFNMLYKLYSPYVVFSVQ
jgi:hypothetical protein